MNKSNEELQIRLNALADGQLSAQESEALLERIENDGELREALCDIHRLKDMVKYAYADSRPPQRSHETLRHWRGTLSAVAAVLLLTLGFMGGRLSAPMNGLAPFELGEVQSQPNKIVLFIGHSDSGKFQRVLDQAEGLLKEYAGKGVEVNVVASAGGIDLLRTATTPYRQRIEDLSASYAALQFVACNNTLANLVREGKSVNLVESAVIKPSAVQFVVERLRQGWSYVAI